MLQKEDVLNWFTQLVNALNFLNDHCVVHRDMKLDNMLLAANNVLKIADFGTAVQLERDMSIPFFQGLYMLQKKNAVVDRGRLCVVHMHVHSHLVNMYAESTI